MDGDWLGLTNTTCIFVPGASDTAFALCALLNSLPLEFRYRALGGLGKLTSSGMFEYFENQIGDLPIPDFDAEANKPAIADLAKRGQRAHELFQSRYDLVHAWHDVWKGMAIYSPRPLAGYCDPAHPVYAKEIIASSANAALAGEVLSLRVEVTPDGFDLQGLIADPNDDDAPRAWLPVAHLAIARPSLRNLLLARAVQLTEFDDSFRRKRSLGAGESVFQVALDAITVPEFDLRAGDKNLATIETVAARVAEKVKTSDLHAVMTEWRENLRAIDDVACALYGVTAERELMEEALRVVL